MLKKRLEEANKSLQADPLVRAEEIKKLRRVVRDKESDRNSYLSELEQFLPKI